ncbi:sugar transferase [Leptolyngbya boryana]|uniref:sugar transferase n=1 Tax=Leptolyngbya boryana TaxID=1184 RepID=UPI00037F7BCD|nr:sugar transferase [Leptolyngbya boryana]
MFNPTLASSFTDSQIASTNFQVPHRSTTSFLKRAIDIVGSVAGLLIVAILFVPLAIAIRLDSPGPIFYGQERHGFMGRQGQYRRDQNCPENRQGQ